LIDKYVDSVALQNCSYSKIFGGAFSRFRKFLTLVQGSGIVSVADRIMVLLSAVSYISVIKSLWLDKNLLKKLFVVIWRWRQNRLPKCWDYGQCLKYQSRLWVYMYIC